MKISRNTVATVSFTTLDEQGQVVSRTEPGHPLVALIGHGFLVPGLEKALDGHEPGDEFSVTLHPADSYGEFDESKVQTLDRRMFGDMPIEPGYVFEAEGASGSSILVTVKEVHDDKVVVDGNHPYAGKTLTFLVVVEDVREATEEEKKHGHAHVDGHCPSEHHGHGCCHHHDGEEGEHGCCHHHDGADDDHGCCHHHDGEEGGHGCCHHHDGEEGGHGCCHHHDGEEGGHGCCHHHDGEEGDHGCCHHHDGEEDGHGHGHHHDGEEGAHGHHHEGEADGHGHGHHHDGGHDDHGQHRHEHEGGM